MASTVGEPIVFLVPGWEERPGPVARGSRGAGPDAADVPIPGDVKQVVRVGATRAGATRAGAAPAPVRVTAVPGEDVVVLDIANGPSLVLHPESARDLLLAQRDEERDRATRDRAARGGNGQAGDAPPREPPARDARGLAVLEDAPPEIPVPVQLRWREGDAGGATRGGTRGFLGDVILKAVRVVTGRAKDPAADLVASEVVRRFDGRVNEGVYALRPDVLAPLGPNGTPLTAVPPAADAKPLLVLVHGTFSNTHGTFSKLWTEHPDLVQTLFHKYPDRVYALDHRTLGVSPIANALTLARALPDGASVHLLTHSRGGLVAEVLARVCSDPTGRDVAAHFKGPAYAEQRAQLAELAELAQRKKLTVARIVRVACPARGTLLASRRLDAYLSVVRWSLSLAQIPIAPELVDFLAEVAQRRTDPAVLPGLAAQMPDSPLVQWLHAAPQEIAGELRVIAGDMEGDSVTSWLKTLVADAFYWTDNDLVVHTRSMYGGAARASTASFILDQGGTVSHFGYFANPRTARAVVDGLVEADPRDFREIGPLSAAGKSSTGVRAARRAARATRPAAANAGRVSDRPAVFVLPGILGSNLRVGEERVWLGWRMVNGLQRLKYGTAGVKPDGPMELFYEDLVAHLEDTHDVVEFAYDWRVPIEEEAQRLAKAVEAALDARATSQKPVRILAHSMGGVLARTMWLKHPKVWARMMAHDEARLLMLGTPNGGSWAPMQVLSGDDTFGNLLAVVGAPFRERDARALMAAFPGFLQLQAGLLDEPRTTASGLELRLDTVQGWKNLAQDDLDHAGRRSVWHVLTRERDAWGVPTQEVLDRAIELRRGLDAQLKTDLVRWAGKLAVVVGKAPFTPDGYVVTRDDGLSYLDAQEVGDGRVTIQSAVLPGVRTWRVDRDHGGLPRERDAFAAYVDLLEQGHTTRLHEVPASERGGAAGHVRSRPARGRMSTQPPESEVEILQRDRRREIDAPAARGTALRVSVLNGDLTFVPHPILVGHYRSLRLTGTERVLDRHLGIASDGSGEGVMARALRMGLYPSDPQTNKTFVNQRADPPVPGRLPRPQAVIVAGLGPEGELRASDLVSTVRQAVVAWAERAAELSPTIGQVELAATLIGSGGAGVSAGQSAQLVAQGVWEANMRLAESGWPQVEHLHLIELYHDRAVEAWRALQFLAAATPERFDIARDLRAGVGALRRPLDADYRGADYDFLSVQSPEQTTAATKIEYRLDTRRARTEVVGQSVQGKLVRELVVSASNDRSTGVQIRRTLFQLLVPLELEPFLAGSTELVIEVDRQTAGIPWEMLDTVAGGSTAELPWAIRAKLLRKFRTDDFRHDPTDADAEASILVVGEPACDTVKYPRLPGARAEADAVANSLCSALRDSGGTVASLISPDDPKRQGADARTIIDALLERPWRVVHVAGHGEPPQPPEEGGNPRGVVLSNDTYLGPFEIRGMRTVPELVFVNCCHLAARDPRETLPDMGAPDKAAPRKGPPDRSQFAANVAEELIKIGVRCVIAAGWAVEDEAAGAFATTFYGALTRGQRFIDAVDEARRKAFEHGGNTWAAYQCYGDPDWVLHRARDGAQSSAEPIRDELAGIASPAMLVLALERLAVQNEFWHLPQETQRLKLENLEARFAQPPDPDRPRSWRAIGSVAEGFGAAWQAADDAERAIAWYELALSANDGTVSMKAAEQLGDLRVRRAWESVEGAARRGRGTTAQRRARLQATIDTARDAIGAATVKLKQLAAVQPTMERESLLGAAYKRLAMIEAIAERPGAEQDAVEVMLRHYADAERLGIEQGLPDVFHPAMNRMAAELFLNAGRAGWRGFDEARLRLIRDSLDAKVRDDPDFWSVAGQAELIVLEAVARGVLVDVLPLVLDDFADLHGRVPAKGKWASVCDQAELVLRRYRQRVGVDEQQAVEELLARLQEYAGRS